MDKISKAIMTIGAIISMLAVCCLDSVGIYGYFAGLVAILGGVIVGAGYVILLAENRKKEGRKDSFYAVCRRDRLDADLEFIQLKQK